MLLINITEQYNEDDYARHYTYTNNFGMNDFDNIQDIEKDILINFFGEGSEKIEHSRVTCISQITKNEIEVLKKYNIVNGRLI